jgi:hypothetical protein
MFHILVLILLSELVLYLMIGGKTSPCFSCLIVRRSGLRVNARPGASSWASHGSYRLVGLVGHVLYSGSGTTTARPAEL